MCVGSMLTASCIDTSSSMPSDRLAVAQRRPPVATPLRPQRVEPRRRHIRQGNVETSGQALGHGGGSRDQLAREQLRQDAVKPAGDRQPRAATEVEREFLQPQFCRVRRIVGMQLAAGDRQGPAEQQFVSRRPSPKPRSSRALSASTGRKIEAKAERARNRHPRLRQRRQRRRQRRQRRRVEPIERHLKIELLRRGGIAIGGVQLGCVAAERAPPATGRRRPLARCVRARRRPGWPATLCPSAGRRPLPSRRGCKAGAIGSTGHRRAAA